MNQAFISSYFSFEPIVRNKAGGKKLVGPMGPFVGSHHGRNIAKKVFGYDKRGKKLVTFDEDTDLIFWDVIP